MVKNTFITSSSIEPYEFWFIDPIIVHICTDYLVGIEESCLIIQVRALQFLLRSADILATIKSSCYAEISLIRST